MSDKSNPLVIPALFCGYTTDTLLGQGSFCSVYKAAKDGKEYALKCCAVGLGNERNVGMLKSEIEILAKIQAASTKYTTGNIASLDAVSKFRSNGVCNVPKCHEILETDCVIAAVLNLIPGKELFDVILDRHMVVEGVALGLTDSEAKEIVFQLLTTLCFLHGEGIAHGDLKLENVMVDFLKGTEKNEKLGITLIDFGLSSVQSTALNPDENSASFIVKGSEPYLSPQAALRTTSSALKNDIWALGVLTFAILTSRMPFDVDQNTLRPGNVLQRSRTILRRIAVGTFQWTDLECREISVEARGIVGEMLVRDPEKRKSALELLKNPWLKNLADKCIN